MRVSSQGRNKHRATDGVDEQAGTANGHSVGAASSGGSSGVSVRRSNQLKLQAGLPVVRSYVPGNGKRLYAISLLLQESTPKFLNVEVVSSQKLVSVTVDGTTVSPTRGQWPYRRAASELRRSNLASDLSDLNCPHIQNPERLFGVEVIYRDFLVSTTYWQKLAERPYKCQLHSSFWAKIKSKILNFVKF